jgi:hypothetical protein
MLVVSKNQVWWDLERQMSRTIDSLGKHIDTGIMDVVVALNASDIHTTASCEGHLDWGTPYPWVDIGSPLTAPVGQQIAELLYEGKKGSEEVEALYREIKRLHLQEEMKLEEALEAFYQRRPLHYDRHLVYVHDIRGECRVQSQGADTQEIRSAEEQGTKLQAYQQEMHSFALFLKEGFFNEH